MSPNEHWYTDCGAGFGWRGITEDDGDLLSHHFSRHQKAYGALIRRYREDFHPYRAFRNRVIWRHRGLIADEPKANLLLAPELLPEPLPGRVYLLLILAEETPGFVIRKAAANFILAEAGRGGSLEHASRRTVEDLLLRILSWPEESPPFAGEWGLTSLEGIPIPPEIEPARTLVSSVLAHGRLPAALDRKETPAPWLLTLANDEELDALRPNSPELPPLEKARRPARFESDVVIRLKERAVFPDGLEIVYWGTSHKRTHPGDPSCAVPHLDLTAGGATEMISPHWVCQGRKCRGETSTWGGYSIELRGLDYDKEVLVRVTATRASGTSAGAPSSASDSAPSRTPPGPA